jgi:hypothetical protein
MPYAFCFADTANFSMDDTSFLLINRTVPFYIFGNLQKFWLTFSNKEVRILQVRVRKEIDDAYHVERPGHHPD